MRSSKGTVDRLIPAVASRLYKYARRLLERISEAIGVSGPRWDAGRVSLLHEDSAAYLRSIWAQLESEGDLIVEGHDLSNGVESLAGYGEYEWTLTVGAADTPKLLAALNGERDSCGVVRSGRGLLDALSRRFSGSNATQLAPFLKENSVPYSFWNRIGD